jgi:dTDP-glucose 4,6-dehydratase/UDP-glucose 4-epimerase
MTYNGARVLVTGGLGYIGSTLARRLLAEGAEVAVVDSLNPDYGGNRYNLAGVEDRLAVHVLDVRDSSALEPLLVGRDYVFNLAAQTSHVGSMQDPQTDFAINAQAQLAMLECCRRVNPGLKIVYGSTRQLYGRPRYLPVDEQHPIRPVDVNGVSKLAGEGFHLLYNDVYSVRSCVLRLTNVFGPRMRIKDARQTFIGFWIRRLLEGKTIPVYGDGSQRRDLLYVDDCVEALCRAGENGAVDGGVFNIGGSVVTTLLELATSMMRLGSGSGVELVPFPAERKAIDIGDYYSDSALFEQATGWTPQITLEEGLRRTMDFYRAHMDRYV